MKVENIGNKIFLIAMLCIGLGLFLYVRPMLFAPDPEPRLEDRLPEGDVIGRVKIFDLAKQSNEMLFKQQFPLREYLTADFLLTQAKNYGLDLQDPVYFFANGKKEWGAFITVSDSSMLLPGLTRIHQFFEVKDTIVHHVKVRKIDGLNLYVYYDKHYAFVYYGNKLKQRLGKALFAKYGEAETVWRRFKKTKAFTKESLVVYTQHPSLKKYGVDYGLLAYECDSAQIHLKSYFHSNYDLKVKMKSSGIAFLPTAKPSKMFHVHLDISELKKDKKHPLYKLITEMGRKVSFPTDDFFEAWDGDMSYLEGGTQIIEEEYIEMGVDDEFNPIEIRKTKEIPIQGFSAMISVNDAGQQLVSKLFAKGIVNKQGNRYRFLFSPPVRLNIQPNQLSAYTSNGSPKIINEATTYGIWNYRGTRIHVKLDSLSKRDIYGTISFDAKAILKQAKRF